MHSASYFLIPRLAAALPEVFARARAAGAGTSLDTNWDPSRTWAGVDRLLDHTDVLLPNAAELLALTGSTDRDEAARVVLAHGCQVALKDGAEGGVLWQAADVVTRVPAPVVTAIDTTGAGDSFDAGFISALVGGLSREACLARAVECGSLSTRAPGRISLDLVHLRQWCAAPLGPTTQEDTMGKTGRKRRGRKKKAANHGKRPNA